MQNVSKGVGARGCYRFANFFLTISKFGNVPEAIRLADFTSISLTPLILAPRSTWQVVVDYIAWPLLGVFLLLIMLMRRTMRQILSVVTLIFKINLTLIFSVNSEMTEYNRRIVQRNRDHRRTLKANRSQMSRGLHMIARLSIAPDTVRPLVVDEQMNGGQFGVESG